YGTRNSIFVCDCFAFGHSFAGGPRQPRRRSSSAPASGRRMVVRRPEQQDQRRRRRSSPSPAVAAPSNAREAGSGIAPGVSLPKVTSSKTIWLATPLKLIDWAVPAKVTPNGTNGQKPAL